MKRKTSQHRRGIYLLPNLFTTAGLFAGFYAVVAALKGLFDISAMAIFIAMILDGLDGRIARMTGTESEFGAEYDSLADIISFGIAPALLVYSWNLAVLGKLGWIAAFVYVAATALRLARFNTQLGYVDKKFFIGVPCPVAAGVVASMVWLIDQLQIGMNMWMIGTVAIIVASVGLLMVSPIRYYSFKEIDLKGKVPFLALLIFLVLILAIAWQPPVVLFILFGGYTLSGPVIFVYRAYRKRTRRSKV